MLCLIFILYIYIAYSFSLEIANLFRSCRFSRGIGYFLGKGEEKILCCAWSSSYAAYSLSLKIANLFRSCRFFVGIGYFLGKGEEKILSCAWSSSCTLTPYILFPLKLQICFDLADFPMESDIFWRRKKTKYYAVFDFHLVHLHRIFFFSWNRKSISILPIFPWNRIFFGERGRKNTVLCLIFILYIYITYSPSLEICFDLADFPVESNIFGRGRKKKYCAAFDFHFVHLYRIFSFSWNRKSVSILPIFPWKIYYIFFGEEGRKNTVLRSSSYAAYSLSLEIANLFLSCRFFRGIGYFWKRERERERKDTVLCLIFIFYIYIAYSPSLEIENLFRSCRFFCRIVYFGRGKGWRDLY